MVCGLGGRVPGSVGRWSDGFSEAVSHTLLHGSSSGRQTFTGGEGKGKERGKEGGEGKMYRAEIWSVQFSELCR